MKFSTVVPTREHKRKCSYLIEAAEDELVLGQPVCRACWAQLRIKHIACALAVVVGETREPRGHVEHFLGEVGVALLRLRRRDRRRIAHNVVNVARAHGSAEAHKGDRDRRGLQREDLGARALREAVAVDEHVDAVRVDAARCLAVRQARQVDEALRLSLHLEAPLRII